MNLRQLHHVVLLAETLNFHRAAERAHLTQPSFSRSIAAFEEEVGLRIFDRGAGGVHLTSVGGLVVERARRLLFDAKNLSHDLALIRNAELGSVSFGAGPFPASSIVPNVLRSFHSLHPKISIHVEVSNWEQLLKMLLEEKIDFFIADTRAMPSDERIEIASLGGLPIGFFCCREHPLLSRHGNELDRNNARLNLLNYPLASVRIPTVIMHELASLLGVAPEAELLQIECDDITLLKQLLPGTNIVLICAEMLVRPEMGRGDIVQVPVENLAPAYGNWGIVKLFGRTLPPAAQIVSDGLRAQMLIETSTSHR